MGAPAPARSYPDRALLQRAQALRRLYQRRFRTSVVGWERVPDGAALLVGNHCGGMISPEAVLTVLGWYERTRYQEPLLLLGHDVLFEWLPPVAELARRFGGVPAGHERAAQALRQGGKALVYPGGDYEAMRPSADRDLIDFGGRRGFAQLALRTGAPVVPVVAAGAHDVVHILTRGETLARLTGLSRWLRVKACPVSWVRPGGLWVGPPLALWPKRCTIRLEVLEPLRLEGDPDDPAAIDAGYRRVTGVMQRALTHLARGLPGRPR